MMRVHTRNNLLLNISTINELIIDFGKKGANRWCAR